LIVADLESLSKKNTLCVEGPAYKHCEDNLGKKDFETLTKYIIIFARVSPYQKELIIEQIKNTGVSVLMCGDGTNDVGGLKKADVGIALVGLRNEPTKAEKKAEVERVHKVRQDAMKMKRFPTAEELMGNQDVEFKSGDACIAAPFTNKSSNSLKCGKVFGLLKFL
jgi:magnesium-transporting ATPase (P-type)